MVVRTFLFFSMILLLPSFVPASQTFYDPYLHPTRPDDGAGLARVSALGAAFTGIADDATALLFNPGGLGFLDQDQLSFNSDLGLVGTLQERFIAGFPLPGSGGLAFSTSYLDYGTFEGRDGLGSLTSPYGADRMSLGAGAGVEVAQGLAVGLSLQGARNTYAGEGSNELVSSAGLLWKGPQGFRAGVSYLDLAWFSTGSGPSGSLELGLSEDLALDRANGLLMALSGSWESRGESRLKAGAEFGYQHHLFLRAGYQFPLTDPQLNGLSGLTAGVGVHFGDLVLDYAFLPYGDLGIAHRIGLGYYLGSSGSAGAGRAGLPGSDKEKDEKKGPAVMALHAAPTQPPVSVPLVPSVQSRAQEGTPVPPIPAAPAAPLTSKSTAQGQASPVPAGELPKDSLVVQFDMPDDETPTPGAGTAPGDLASLERAVEMSPKDPNAWWNLGNAYRGSKQKEKAVACFEKVLQLQPDNTRLADWLQKYKLAP